jgi:hypothetical protein
MSAMDALGLGLIVVVAVVFVGGSVWDLWIRRNP